MTVPPARGPGEAGAASKKSMKKALKLFLNRLLTLGYG
jgi:hypothetical protein